MAVSRACVVSMVLLCSGCATAPRIQMRPAAPIDRTRYHVLDIAPVIQDQDRACGAAALEMVLAYHGRALPQEQIMRRADDGQRGGLRAEQLRQVAHEQGLRAFIIRGKPAELNSFLDKKIPLIVTRRTFFDGGWGNHYLVLIGRSEDGSELVLNDPKQGQVVATRASFLSDWEASGRFLMIVTPSASESVSESTAATTPPNVSAAWPRRPRGV